MALRYILFIFLLLDVLVAKKDFYYGYINSSGRQISQKMKQDIQDAYDNLEGIKRLYKNGNVKEAFKQVEILKNTNKLKVLTSDIIILYSFLALKINKKRVHINATKQLQRAINSSNINQYDLLNAYFLLSQLKLKINRVNDAKYFAEIIRDNYDDELSKTKGIIALSRVYVYQGDYTKAIRILYKVLANTKNKNVATVVGDELFDVYLYAKKYKEAKELINNILKSNIKYYTTDPYIANNKINKLIDTKMYEYAAEILKQLLDNAITDEAIEHFKYKLANIYMKMYDKSNFYLEKAKELYKDIMNDFPKGIYAKKSKMYIDEILMREGLLKPRLINARYETNKDMKEKALLQELLNYKEDKKFDSILKNKNLFKRISNKTAQRFAFKSINDVFDEIDFDMLKYNLNQKNCTKAIEIFHKSKGGLLDKILASESLKYRFFECLVEEPNKKEYFLLQEKFKDNKDSLIIFYLEQIAYKLGLYDDALKYSLKIAILNNRDVIQKEFIYKYLILKEKNDIKSLLNLYKSVSKDKSFIEKNMNNPVIIDFLYDYYLFLVEDKKQKESKEVLSKLYNIQKDFKAYIYSPFVDIELSKQSSNKQEALNYLLEALKNTRRLKANDEVRIYYELLNIYDKMGNKDKKAEYIQKCKEVKNSKDSLYKKMCDGMK